MACLNTNLALWCQYFLHTDATSTLQFHHIRPRKLLTAALDSSDSGRNTDYTAASNLSDGDTACTAKLSTVIHTALYTAAEH
jgi:hypothetical protein